MIFLGLAANYSVGGVFRHLFATGSPQDAEALRQYLADKYSTPDLQLEANRVALYHNGRSALSVAVRNLVPRGSEVIVNGFTCQAVVQAVKEAKCKPVYADINAETLHFDASTLRACLRRHPEARALIVQNTLGHPVEIQEIEALARARKLIIIEDLAHGVSQHYPDGREVGTVGAATALSFGKGKAVDAISGGALIMRQGEKLPSQPIENPRLSDRLRDRFYPLFGLMTRGLYHVAGLGKYFMSFLVKTHQVQRSADAEVDPQVRLSHWQAKLVLTQLQMLDVLPAVAQAPLRQFYLVEDREEVLDKLERAQCYVRELWYETPIAPKRYYARQKFPEAECPVAVQVAAQIVNLPTYYDEERLKPSLAIIQGEDPRAEERARRAAKVAAKAAKMEAKAAKIKSGELEMGTREQLAAAKQAVEQAQAAKKAAKAAKAAAEPSKRERKSRHDKANAKIEAARAAEEGGFEAGFRTTDIDFMEIVSEAPAEVNAAPVLTKKTTSAKTAAPIKKTAPAKKTASAPKKTEASAKSPASAPAKTAATQNVAQQTKSVSSKPRATGSKQPLKSASAEPEVRPVTQANAVLKTKTPAPPKINARKNEFFERKERKDGKESKGGSR